MLEYEFYLSCIFPHKDGIYESVLIWEYTVRRKPVFWHILQSVTKPSVYFSISYLIPVNSVKMTDPSASEVLGRLLVLATFSNYITKTWNLQKLKIKKTI